MRKTSRLPPLLLLLLCLHSALAAVSLQEDDLVFDDVGDDAAPTLSSDAASSSTSAAAASPAKSKWQRVEKLLGMPDAVASVGRVFKLRVPKQAFAGSVDYYEARGINNKALPHWLRWDEPASAFYGVPARKDIGRHRVNVKAFGKHGDSTQDSFYVHVIPEEFKHYRAKDDRKRCSEEQDRTMLSILVDARYENLKPSAKVNALENLAGFFALPVSSLTIQPDASSVSSPTEKDTAVILSGPGHVKHRRENSHSTVVQWQVGCDGHFWSQHVPTIKGFPEQARDGTLSEVMQLPVYQWRVRSDSTNYARNRRDTAGSGDDLRPDGEDDEEYDEEDYDDDNDYDTNEGITEAPAGRTDAKRKQPALHPGESIVDEHPHRHHHGEDSVANIGGGAGLSNTGDDFIWSEEINSVINKTTPTTSTTTIASTLPSSTTKTTTSTTTESPTTTTPSSTTESTTTESTTSSSTSVATEEPSPSPSTESTTTTPSTTTTTTTPPTTTTETQPIGTLTTENSTSITYNNTTQVVTSQSASGPNVTIDSLTSDNDDEDEEEILTTERDSDNEIEPDLTTILQPNVYVSPESTTTSTTTTTESTTTSTTTTTTTTESTPASSESTSGNVVVESVTTEQQNNATSSIYPVNVTADEYTEAPVPSKEVPTFGTPTWGSENATEKIIAPDAIDPYDSLSVPNYASTIITSTTTTTTTTTTPEPSTTPETISTTTPSTTTTTTTTEPSTTTTSTTPSTTTTTTTEQPTTTTTTTTQAATTTTTTTTERIDLYLPPRNTPPKVERRLKKTSAIQGKLLSYTIPEDTFSDPEDGNTRNLRLKIYERGAPLKQSYWLQFNENTQEVYGLPLDDQYGTYQFEVIAMDKEGLTANDRLDIVVQQHKQSRAFNHEFHIYLKIDKRSEFTSNVDWQLKVMRDLAQLYGDNDLSYITVRSIDIDHDQAIYTWTNDSLARASDCPLEEIKRLYRVMVSDEKREEPSEELLELLGPEIRPKRIVYQGLEHCQSEPKETHVNKYPMPRNQIDQLNATVGQLFTYKVPKDTFFDEEDGDTRSMKAYLLTGDRTEVPANNWLQFDGSNQEFFGVPLKEDVGRKSYQLVVKDREGLEATDSLIAEVRPAPVVHNVMESSMTIGISSESFKSSSEYKREFVKKLQRLYGDKDPSAISLLSVSGNSASTTVTWRNLTLPTGYCPHDEIQQLRRVLVGDDKTLTQEVYSEFNSDSFPVEYVSVVPQGKCNEHSGHAHPPETGSSDRMPATRGKKEEAKESILMTYILPSVIIVAMIMLAGTIACILYKRRRSGKMSISEKDDERQSFRSRGIPVIFQDELDEKPDPGNKSPVILKEEKPPLPPPEYQRAEDGADIPMLSKENSEEPYQPPPPFATNRDSSRQNRPKPTPTYRKPPPYVPP